MLSYKFVNTFIDDLFAFVIRMPTMYRLGVFRDDIIFLVYIYQRWIYRVDPKRVNEYGVSMEDPTGATAAATEDAALLSIDEQAHPSTSKDDAQNGTAKECKAESKKDK